MKRHIESSTDSFPCSCKSMIAAAVNDLVIEPIANFVSGVFGTPCSRSAKPYAFFIRTSPSRTTKIVPQYGFSLSFMYWSRRFPAELSTTSFVAGEVAGTRLLGDGDATSIFTVDSDLTTRVCSADTVVSSICSRSGEVLHEASNMKSIGNPVEKNERRRSFGTIYHTPLTLRTY